MKESKQSKSRSLRRLLILLAVGTPLIVTVLQYYRVQGFKNTLEYLVDTETDGAFQLTIGNTDIDYLQLSFALNQVAVSKTMSDSLTAGVSEVTTERIKVRFGSLWTLWSGKQLQIEELLITEPVARVGIQKAPDPERSSSQAPVNVAHQIARFSPAIVSLLNQFDIEFFYIERARMELDKSENIIEVRLIDLLVANWNMRQLSDESTLRLSLEEQSIDFATSQFSFGSIVYDYQQSQLEIQDYEFVQNDSLNRPVINATGESLLVADLDFQALIEDERYVLGEIVMNRPAIVVQVYPHQRRENNIKYPLSTLLKRNLRELELGVCNIEDASMDLYLYHQSDTVHVQLPDLDLRSKELLVTEDSSTLMIGSVNLELGNTQFDPGNGLALSFSKLIYDDNYYAEVDNIELIDNETGKELMSSEFLKLFNFNFFHYYYENEIAADSMILRNGSLKTNHGAPRLSSANRSKTGKPSLRKVPTIGISKVVLDQMDLNLDLGDRQLQSRQMTTMVDNLKRDEGLEYQLRYLSCPSLTYHDPEKNIEVEVLDVVYGPGSLTVAGLEGNYHGLALGLDHLAAQLKHNFTLDEPWHYQLSTIDINRLELSGQVPVAKNSKPPADMEIQAIAMDTILVDLELSNGAQLNLQGTQLLIDQPQFIDQQLGIEKVAVDLTHSSYVSDSMEFSVEEAHIDNHSNSLLNQLAIKMSSGHGVKAEKIEIGPWVKNLDTASFDHVILSDLAISQPRVAAVSTADSILVRKIGLDQQQGPLIDLVEVYAPNIHLPAGDKNRTRTEKGIDLSPLDRFGKIQVHPGQLTMNDKALTFNSILYEQVDKQRSVDLTDLAFETPASSFHVGHFWTTAESINIDTITVVPTQTFLDQVALEQDIVAGQFYHIQARQLDWDALIDSSKLIAEDLLIDGFEVSIKRDKTLPDPPVEIKPHLLAALVPELEGVSIPKIIASNGNLSYLEVGDKTGAEGRVRINNINATWKHSQPIDQPEEVLRAQAQLYEQGVVEVTYNRLDSSRFELKVTLKDFPAEQLNEMVDPLEAAKIESGVIGWYEFQVIADGQQARGQSKMTYDDLHVRIFKRRSPDQRNLGSDLLTLLVDDVILKHSKTDAVADFSRDRITFKGPFNYWAKIGIEGAVAAIKKGKKEKKSKK